METQQMMELVLARFNASMKEHMQQMKAEMKPAQARAKANREDLKGMIEEMMEIMKRAVGISSGLRRIRNWTLWRGRPPPKWKEITHGVRAG
jgi:hypothetical protein